jgi:glyoxylase I family protein
MTMSWACPARWRSVVIVGVGAAGIHHVVIMVEDVEDCSSCYVDFLGLRVRPVLPAYDVGGPWLDVGDQQLHLIAGGTPERASHHFAISSSDISDVVLRRRANEFEVSDPVTSMSGLQADVTDPAGNRVELWQPLSPANDV